MIVCVCDRVSEKEIRDAADFLKATSIEDLQKGLRICENCKVCTPFVEEILRLESFSG